MTWIVQYLWLIPALPLLAAGISALCRQPSRKLAASLAIGSMALAFLLSCVAFSATLGHHELFRETYNFTWFQFGESSLRLGWVLDPLTACMLVMVTFVGLLIFIFSVGYMAQDQNFMRFFCFLSLFAAAMLGIVIANSLLLLFMSWELVGLASYLLIGFWYHKPSAAAAAKKAFITTRIGDIGFFLGILWLYQQTGTLLFYDNGQGCLEYSALSKMISHVLFAGVTVATVVALLIFCGAAGKSGQVPLHVWLPDAMEGPTPVSALIHAATMVAAGVFLVARVYPLMSNDLTGAATGSLALSVVTWVGAITALFAALTAVAQTDIKRILAYSTVSQLGYMMMGLGVGGIAFGMFHLITHAFFKALLFLGSASVIHGCHEEQDIRQMGGLSKYMRVTFITYAIGMLALAGLVPFAGFWSKDAILHAAHSWPASRWPFYFGAVGAFLTAFYMTRQVCYVFFGNYRGKKKSGHAHAHDHAHHGHEPHESPPVMTIPLAILAAFALLLGLVGTPFQPWFQTYLTGEHEVLEMTSVLKLMVGSTVIVLIGLSLGWLLYGRRGIAGAGSPDVLERWNPGLFAILKNKFYIDELYELSVIHLYRQLAVLSDWLDRFIWNGLVQIVALLALGLAWLSHYTDQFVVNLGFDTGCQAVRESGEGISGGQNGQVQHYLRVLALALTVLVLLAVWGWNP